MAAEEIHQLADAASFGGNKVCTCGAEGYGQRWFDEHVRWEELKVEHPNHFHVPCKEAGEVGGWAFVLAARSRGWTVSDPRHNGVGYYHVTVWDKGPDAKVPAAGA